MAVYLLIDGYNVIGPVAPPRRGDRSDWLQRERNLLVQRLAKHLPASVRQRCCVVFDAADAPRDVPDQYQVDGILVRFARGYPEADDLLEELIQSHPSPKQLRVISSDHRIMTAARQRNAVAWDSQIWLDALIENRLDLGQTPASGSTTDEKPASQPMEQSELKQWLQEFGFDDDR